MRCRDVLVTAAVAVTMIMAAVPAGAAPSTTTQLSGVGFAVDACAGRGSDVTLELTGDLDGCWYATIDSSRWNEQGGTYLERGTERFEGCLARPGQPDVCGAFETTYLFTAKFPPGPEPDIAQEIRGRCQHPIVVGSGEGGFAGVTGRVDIKDDVEAGEYPYRGHIKLPS